MAPTVEFELALRAAGHQRIAGVDEVGRGCWAGPVVAAAVVLPPGVFAQPALLQGVNDSKQLSGAQRERLAERVLALADDWGIGAVPAVVIDTHGILVATRLAMQIALLRLARPADALLIDAVRLEHWPCPQQSLIKGDARCLSIAAASIVAKVARDRSMRVLGQSYPEYGFALHKGYGTALHERALLAHGPSVQHRRSFRPLAEFLTNGAWPARGRASGLGDDLSSQE